jgi:UMF1 family MFS transporter
MHKTIEQPRKKVQRAWAFYDWANSVYSLVISTAIFPIYYAEATRDLETVRFLGFQWKPDPLYAFALSFSFCLVVLLSPILSGIADYSGRKKDFLKTFCYLGAAACMGLFFFSGENVGLAIGFSILASVGFWGSLVFYNAYLPEIAHPEEQDLLSARGFAMGYIGSSLLLVFNLSMILAPETYGLSDAGMASRISFLTVGLWWAGFAQFTFARLPQKKNAGLLAQPNILGKGFKELKKVFGYIKNEDKPLKIFLIAFFMYSIGVQTVIQLASIFGSSELGLSSVDLIATILIIQFIAIGGALLFARISSKLGNIRTLQIQVVVWMLVCVGAFLMHKSDTYVKLEFYALGGAVGLVMGGIQSLSRSTYSKLLPQTEDTTSFFSFFDVTEKLAIVVGTLTFGLVTYINDSMNKAVLALAVFFAIGWLALQFAKRAIDAPKKSRG